MAATFYVHSCSLWITIGNSEPEVDWNNKGPFFDRDLNLVLFELRAIDVGVIMTRGSELQKIFNRLGKGASSGRATAHREKLIPRLDGGGAGCPLPAFASSEGLYLGDVTPPASGVPSPN